MEGPQVVRRPLVSAATGFCFGVLAAPAGALAADLVLLVSFVVVVVALARARRVLAALALPLPFFFAGLVAATLRLPPTHGFGPEHLDRDGAVVEGRIREAVRRGPDADRFVVDASAAAPSWGAPLAPIEGRIDVWSARRAEPCGAAGDRIRFLARLREPEPALVPGRDSARLLAARRGVSLFGTISDPASCVRLAAAEGAGLRLHAERLREALHAAIDRALPAERAAVVKAFATGDRSAIDPALETDFQRSGLSHLLAVSGLNLAILSGLFAVGLAWIFRWSPAITLGFGPTRLAALFAIPFAIFYTLLVGASPSAVRAAIMVVALLVAYLARRTTEPWSALAAAVLVMLAWDPTTLGDVSFQLSFAAVAALLRVYPALRAALVPRLAQWPALGRWPMEVALASTAATIGTLPLVARHFARVSLAGILANVPAAPLGSLILVPLSFLGGALGAIEDALGAPLLALAGHAAALLAALARGAAALPLASLAVPRPSALECVLFYAATIGFTVVPGSPRARKAGLAAFGALLLTSAGFTAARWLERGVAVSFLPVGQGDAALVELPGGATMLVDTGPAFGRGDAAARVIVPYLRARRITRLDRVVLTHPHADHTGGLATLAREIPIDRVWWTGDRREAPTAVLAPLDGLEVEVVEPGSRWMVGAASVEVLGPVGGPGAPIVNDGSVVLAVRIGRRTILLSGDAEAEAERRLVETHGERLRADVLKAGHHGSRTSSTDPFLAAARPAHVVLSLGRGNLFGFPHAEALARIRNAGAEIWRTDLDGLVRVETDGEELRIRGHARSPTAGGRL